MQYKLTPGMRKQVKKMEYYSEKINFLCKYKLETISAVIDLKEKKLEEKQVLLNTRNRLYYKRGNIENESKKDQTTEQIIQVTEQLKRLRKKLICVMRLQIMWLK